MLVISRRANQDIVIDGNIRVRVCAIGDGTVRLGIEAPFEIAVTRPDRRAAAGRAETGETPVPPGGDV